VQVVSYSSLGHSNKMIAYELGLGEHAIGEHLRRAAKKLGVSRRIELLKIARALRELPQPHEGAPGDDAKRTEGGSRLQDNASEVGAGAGLTASERSVVQLAYDGLSDRDIARARGTSARTVANQLRSAFRRLGIGSRVELVRRLLISR
jgi:DNA-binding NarL/FixJ family response regulator